MKQPGFHGVAHGMSATLHTFAGYSRPSEGIIKGQ